MPDIVMSCPLDMVFLTSPTSSVRLEMHSGRSICKRAATLPVTEFRINFLYFSHIYDCRQSRLSRVATTTTATAATATLARLDVDFSGRGGLVRGIGCGFRHIRNPERSAGSGRSAGLGVDFLGRRQLFAFDFRGCRVAGFGCGFSWSMIWSRIFGDPRDFCLGFQLWRTFLFRIPVVAHIFV